VTDAPFFSSDTGAATADPGFWPNGIPTGPNDPPAPVTQSYSATEDTPLTVEANSGLLVGATDADGDSMTVLSVTSPTTQDGTVTLNGAAGAFTYTPAANFNGQDTFNFTVGDGNAGTAIQQATITVGRLHGSACRVVRLEISEIDCFGNSCIGG